ncbi:hypothetical protein RHMOL_Rhmol04G0207900 [Rhododendron molle]|uniref:Uncharacterized protein n=1 Tax=Rhododendron molle TaxID=49168 RepID=A0ACC0P2U2_RHOML|nr:hypothetical protein RHMOL_Rhmol04G0207900 [Rhododendron molle]
MIDKGNTDDTEVADKFANTALAIVEITAFEREEAGIKLPREYNITAANPILPLSPKVAQVNTMVEMKHLNSKISPQPLWRIPFFFG